MDINLHNYEACFLDYTEGNLNEQQVADLLLFLENHPALKTEFEQDFSDVTLTPQTLKFNNKNQLKKPELINAQNVDDFMIAQNEGLLNDKSSNELNAFVTANNLEKEQKLYSLVYLAKSNIHRFPNKRKLKKGGFVMPLFARYAAAAAILLLIAFAWLLNQPNNNISGPRFAHENNTIAPQNMLPTIVVSPSQKQLLNQSIAISNNKIGETQLENLSRSQKTETGKKAEIKNAENPINNSVVLASALTQSINNTAIEPYLIFTSNPTTQTIAQVNQPIISNTQPQALKNFSQAKELTLWQYAGVKFKQRVLGSENATDGRIRENDVAHAFAVGINKLSNNQLISFQDKSQNNQIEYDFHIGKVGFTRSLTKP